MALLYTPSNALSASAAPNSQEETFDISVKREELNKALVNSKEVDDIVSTINVNEPQTIVAFGSEAAEEISKCSDSILNSINMAQVNDSGKLLNQLGTIMDKFDIEEIAANEKKGMFSKIFSNAQKQLDQILSKYHTMGGEVDKVYVTLKEYEKEIGESNKKLDSMFQTNVSYYQKLVKYILAGEQGLNEIDQYITDMSAQYAQEADPMVKLDLDNLSQAKIILDQRVQDLRIAENVAMQSIPMIKSMQYSNLNLIRKINSAFIITLPVFKQALTQSILLKRQKIQADAMQALDERTNEMLLKNAQNTADQTRLTAQLASGSSVKIETLEKTWETIVKGIEDTKKIQEDANQKRKDDAKRLATMKAEFAEKMNLQ